MNSAKARHYEFVAARAYTFIEVLIATLIFSIVALSIYSVFQTGSIAYKKLDSAFELYQKARIIFNRIETDLKNSFVYGEYDAGFSGTRQNLVFFTILDSFNVSGGTSRGISKVKYEFLDSTLRRTQTDGLDILRQGSQEASEGLVEQLQDLSFQFAIRDAGNAEKNYSWQDSWPVSIGEQDAGQKVSLPLAVKVEMLLGDLKFTKIIPLTQSYFGKDA